MPKFNKILSVSFKQKIDSWKPPRINSRTGIFYSSINRHAKEDMRAKLLESGIKQISTEEPVVLSFCFIFKMPRLWKRARRFPSKKDVTNCQKLFEDALSGYIYDDDRQVVAVTDFKIWGGEDEVIIEVHEIEDRSAYHIDSPTILEGMRLAISSLEKKVLNRSNVIFSGCRHPVDHSCDRDNEYNNSDNEHTS